MSTSQDINIPESILIIGAGVFGLSTAKALLSSPRYTFSNITLLDAFVPPPQTDGPTSSAASDLEEVALPLTTSLDSSRIIRADYAESAYAALAAEAQTHWRRGWPFPRDSEDNQLVDPIEGPKIYHEVGLIITASEENSNKQANDYVKASLLNVKELQSQEGDVNAAPLESRAAIISTLQGSSLAAADTYPCSALGDFGYVNRRSGWADASAAMAGLRTCVQRLATARLSKSGKQGTFTWIQGRAKKPIIKKEADGSTMVAGVELVSGEAIEATLTIVAAGAWSPQVLPRSLGPRLQAAGQPLAYLELTSAEHQMLAGRPVLLNLGSALFGMSPPPISGSKPSRTKPEVFKVAQHGWGYIASSSVPDVEHPERSESEVLLKVSIPPDTTERIPLRSERDLRVFSENIYPDIARGREFCATRLCWYADTATGDFIIDYVPQYGKSCFVATGGSGHGFKFLPVIGERVLQQIEGRLGRGDGHDDQLGGQLARLWRWRSDEEVQKDWEDPGDGSRGGERGLLWEKEKRAL